MNIHVGNLPLNVSADDLKVFFEVFGKNGADRGDTVGAAAQPFGITMAARVAMIIITLDVE